MFDQRSRHIRRLASAANNPTTRWLKLLAILALALYLGGGAAGATPAQAAPGADETIDSLSMEVTEIPSLVCAHTVYYIDVFVRIDRVADRNSNFVELDGGLGPANIFVKGTSSDIGVAGFHPEIKQTAALDNRIGTGADFKLQTEAPGSATLTLDVAMTSAGNRTTFRPFQQSIKVVNCKFRVSMTSIYSGFIPAITETVTSTVNGEIKGNSDGSLTGEAEVTWKFNQATPCLQAIINVSPSPSKAILEGSLSADGGTLTVTVNYDQVMVFQANTVLCGSGASGNHQNQFQPPPLVFQVPSTGKVFSYPAAQQLGQMTVTGTSIISVVPIEQQ